MTAIATQRPRTALPFAGAVVGLGVVALLARPWMLPAGAPHDGRVLLFAVLLVAGLAWPLRPAAVEDDRRRLPVLVPLALGCAAFVAGRALLGLPPRPGDLAAVLALNALAAVAEEAFFRRLVYGVLVPYGTAAAVLGSAVLFAVAHVTVWGLWVLPLDLAAGLLLSWQRAASGRWTVPAATHVLANALAFL
jgi:membrane protease YdiL (CAAX protease family)